MTGEGESFCFPLLRGFKLELSPPTPHLACAKIVGILAPGRKKIRTRAIQFVCNSLENQQNSLPISYFDSYFDGNNLNQSVFPNWVIYIDLPALQWWKHVDQPFRLHAQANLPRPGILVNPSLLQSL